MASEAGQPRSGISQFTTAPTAKVVTTTRPTDSTRIGLRLAVKSTSEVWMAAVYSSGGNSPSSTISGSRWMSGTIGMKDAAAPATMSSSGAGRFSRSLSASPASTTTAIPTRMRAISTAPLCRSGSPTAMAARPVFGRLPSVPQRTER